MDEDTDKEKSRQELNESIRKMMEPDPEVMKRAHKEWARIEKIDPRIAYPYMTKESFRQLMEERNKKTQ